MVGSSALSGPQRIYVLHPHGTKTYAGVTQIDMDGPLKIWRDGELIAAHNEWFYWKVVPPRPQEDDE